MADPSTSSVIYRLDTSQLKALSDAMGELRREMAPVLSRALNTVGRRAYTRIVRGLAKETGAQQKRVRALVRAVPSTPHRLEWKAVARAQYFSLKDFHPRQNSEGVKTTVWGGQFIAHAFIVDSLGGHVFFRQGAPRKMARGLYAGRKRQPLEKLWGPNIAVQMKRGGTGQVLADIGSRDLVPEALRQVDLELMRRAKARIAQAKRLGARALGAVEGSKLPF